MGKNNSLNTAKRGLAPALLALVLSAAIFAGCDDVTKEIGEVSQAPARSAVVIDKGGFLKAVEDSEIKDITVMEGFKVDGDVTINSAKTITIAKGETVSISSLTVNAPLTLNGQDPDVIAAAGALKMAASIGGGTQYGILRVSYGLTVSTASTLELTGEINLLFTAAVMMDDIKVDGLLKVADEALVCKIQIGGEPGTVKLGGSGAVQFGDTEAAPAADTDIELQVVDEPENDLGGGYFDEEEEEDEEEAFNDAIVSSLTLKLDSSGALSNLETDESGKVLKLAVNGTAKLAADITYTSGTAAKVTWLSKSPGAVSVDDNGNVKVISGGSVQITAYAGGKSDTCTVSSAKGAGLYVGDDLIDLSNKTESSMLEKAFSYIKSDNTTANEYTIVLDTNEEDNTGDGYTIGSGAGNAKNAKTTGTKTGLTITIKGTSNAVTIEKKAAGALFTVYGNAATDTPHLILENITLRGYASNTKALVSIGTTNDNKDGELTMKDESRITANSSSHSKAAATGMGGAVVVLPNSKFTMEGGLIDNNKATNDSNGKGAGVYVGGTFNMTGGVIKGNEAGNNGSAVYVAADKIFTKSNGIIYGNDENLGSDANKTNSGHVIFIAYTNDNKWCDDTADENTALDAKDANWSK